ncbi:MAG: sugar ABC transporter substrate-binding protein [Ignavibacteria bacterium]|nr:sugar ABC transporter substrate-binding protein [Ignavibacteria bacterium]
MDGNKAVTQPQCIVTNSHVCSILTRMRAYLPALFAALGLLLSTCSKEDQRVEIEFWTLQLSPTFDSYFHSLIKEYEGSHPAIKIKWVDIPYDVASQKLLASVASGSAPDLVNLSGDFLASFAHKNALAEISTLVQQDTLRMFFPHALEICRQGGKLVALPWYLNTYVLMYNTELLRQAGMGERDVPRTFSELVAFARRYKEKTGRFGLFWNIGKDSYLPIMLESEGVPMIDAEMTRALFDGSRSVALISQWVDLYRQGFLQRESIVNPGSAIIEAYQSGQVAMVLTGPVFLNRVKVNAPAIFRRTDIAPSPVGSTSRQELAAMVLSVMSSSDHPKEAAEFAMFVLDARNQIAFSKFTTTYPSVVRALSDPYFTVNDGTLESKARIVGASTLPVAEQLSGYKKHPEYFRLHEMFCEAVQSACLGRMSTKEALANAAREWNAILQKKNH